MSQKIAVIVQRYGLEINGGAEYHARLIAEKLSRHFPVEVFTTTALDYVTWEHHYPAGSQEINGILINRFRVKRTRDPQKFGEIQNRVFFHEHTIEDELFWLEEEGPFVPDLLDALQKRCAEFDFFLFFSYRYYHSYHGVNRFPEKAVLVPTAEHDDVIYLKIFKSFFLWPAAFIYNSVEEKELINRVSGNDKVPGDIVGVGSEIPDQFDPEGICHQLGIQPPYFLYIGRLDENKGVPQLFHYYQRFAEETGEKMLLVLVGRSWIPVPRHPFIRHLGFLSDQKKFDLLKGAEFLVIPSQYESLSMVCLEAWSLQKPVLVNGRTEVLKGQCQRSQAGLWYENYEEFREALLLLQHDRVLREKMAENGKAYFQANYSWDLIEGKYQKIFSQLRKIQKNSGH